MEGASGGDTLDTMNMTNQELKKLPLPELLLLAASALRWCHEELKHANLEERYKITILHPMRTNIVAVAERLEELSKG